MLHRTPKTPILAAVRPGTMIVGYELHKSLGISAGDRVELMGRTFKVGECNAQRGNKDDITVWINLKEAQELLDKSGKINGILALKCYCYGERLGKIREELARILPDTRLVEVSSKLIARAEARDRAADAAREAVAAERDHRARLRGEREAFAAVREYWRKRIQAGAQIHTAEPMINDFYKAHVSHLLINTEREVGTSNRYMAKVGTLGYGVYSNGSCMMVSDLVAFIGSLDIVLGEIDR